MTERRHDALDAYVRRVMALKEERDAALSDDELRAVALDLGLAEEDLAAVEEAAADHHLRGQGFLEHRRWDDAIAELDEAVAVAPRRLEWLHALARGYEGRWLERHDEADRARAELLVRQCLEIDPRHEASFDLLDRLDREPAAAPRAPAPRRGPAARRTLIAAVGLAVPLIAVVVANQLRREPAPPPTGAWPSAVETPAAVETAAVSELDVPVTLEAEAAGVALGLDVRHSRLKTYGAGKSFYTLNAVLTNEGATELDALGVRLELLDEAGAVLEQEAFKALDRAAPVLRPGDAHALHRLRETSADLRRARLVVDTVEENPAAAAYAPSKELAFDWRTPPPPDLEIALRERSYRFSESAFPQDGSGYFDAVVEVENTGQRTIRALELAAEIVGPEERWVVHENNHVAIASGPALRPGEVRLERFIEKVEGRPDSYRLSVVDVR